ncbi:hypothetical protein [Prescottella agglutinans]|uniref:Uncharacterized protein n=1 Tax=Prescottella agglutinans TaxID=1644129 RepID=A0ABT6MI98_9NOCA|nr:hypothetical protein [Prescottella agglutinans]MDH6284043.1 hypothetical protein [Prescottella agglutinans]
MFIEPLKDLLAWWNRQSDATQKYVNFFTAGIGGGALAAFLARVLQTTTGALATTFGEAFGAIIVGSSLGLVLAALNDCGLQQVTPY